MPRKSPAKPYTGILVAPIPRQTVFTAPEDDPDLDSLLQEKWKALFTHYGLSFADAFDIGPKHAVTWADLAWHLARDHVPGFRGAPRGRGKPATRKDDDITLAMHVDLFRRRDNLSDRKAIKAIAAQGLVSGSETALLQRYKRSKRQFAPLFRMFDNMAAVMGHDAAIQNMEASLFGDDKETILSPL